VTVVDGIPVTTVARTIVDLATCATAEQVGWALPEAERRGVLDVGAVDAVRERVRGRQGSGDAVLRRRRRSTGRMG